MAKSSSRKTTRKSARKSTRKTARTTKKTSARPPRGRKPTPRKTVRSGAPGTAKAGPRTARWVYAFGGGKAAGRAGMRDLLGGKGAGLAEMANLGLPVPPGYTNTTAVCTAYTAGVTT